MLSKQNRLTKSKDFQMVIKKGRTVAGGLAVLKFLVAQPLGYARDFQPLAPARDLRPIPSRIGFVVSSKVAKRAHIRNKIKRRLRGAVRPLLHKIRPGSYCVFLVKKDIVGRDFQQIADDVSGLLMRAGLFGGEKLKVPSITEGPKVPSVSEGRQYDKKNISVDH